MVPIRLGLLGLLCALVLSACGSSAATPTPTPHLTPLPKRGQIDLIGLVTDVGGLHDRSFNQEAWAGIQRAHRKLGVDVVERQSASTKDYVPLLRQMARDRVDLIVAVGSTMALAVHAVAQEYPQEHFAMVDARPQSSPGHEVNDINVANLLFREQEAGYMVGAIAGLMERGHVGKATHNTIGWLGGEDIPPVNRYLAGFQAGARGVDPSISILRKYAGTFGDPALGRTVAHEQTRQGADILFQVAAATGEGYLKAGESQGRYGIGVDTNQSYLGPNIITSALKRVDVAVYRAVLQQRNGHFKPYDHLLGAREGAIGFVPPTRIVPRSIVGRVDAIRTKISRGVIVPPLTLPAR